MAGAEMTQFRSAVHGFNRMDVVRFIESMNSEHEAALHALQKENQALAAQAANLSEENTALAARVAELSERLIALQEPEPEEESAGPEESGAPSTEALELAAYRRAEAAERGAVQRAGALYRQMADVCAGLNSRMAASDEEIGLLYAELTATLDRMRDAMADIKLVFDEAPEQILALSGVMQDDETAH